MTSFGERRKMKPIDFFPLLYHAVTVIQAIFFLFLWLLRLAAGATDSGLCLANLGVLLTEAKFLCEQRPMAHKRRGGHVHSAHKVHGDGEKPRLIFHPYNKKEKNPFP